MDKIILGSRGSKLALWQAEHISRELNESGKAEVEIRIIKTEGDRVQDKSFSEMTGQGFFTKEIEAALLSGEIDLAVHSLKDLMTTMPDGLSLTAVGYREDNREAILIRREAFDIKRPLKIKENGVVGSSSVRRQCQIAEMSHDLKLKDLRGNVPTRVNKLRDGQYSAIIVAYAGLKRLELDVSDLELVLPDKDKFLPAPGQGILGLQTRRDDEKTNAIIKQMDDPVVRKQTQLERGLLARFAGGCQLPLGTYSEIEPERMMLAAVLGCQEDGKWTGLKRARIEGRDINEMIEKTYLALTG